MKYIILILAMILFQACGTDDGVSVSKEEAAITKAIGEIKFETNSCIGDNLTLENCLKGKIEVAYSTFIDLCVDALYETLNGISVCREDTAVPDGYLLETDELMDVLGIDGAVFARSKESFGLYRILCVDDAPSFCKSLFLMNR